jgi:hypothetical protein
VAVRYTDHVLSRLGKRGTSEAEIEDVLSSGSPGAARPGYRGVSKVFEFNAVWGDRFYREKKVRVILRMKAGIRSS